MKERYCILTNDVETTSIVNHCLSDEAGDLVLKEGMPRLLDLYKKYNVKATFFYCGDIIRQHPEVVTMILTDGHEVASHGWDHNSDRAFDVITLEEQMEHLKLSKDLLKKISGKEIMSFRAPALRINENTGLALNKMGFKTDSSIASQRMDMFLSFGVRQKLKWIFSPRKPYYTNPSKIWKKGNSNLFEIPVSALIFPYIGTTLRIMPFMTRLIRLLLHCETVISGKPIVFLTHPNEFMDENADIRETKRRSKNFFGYVFGDIIRRKLKKKNLGAKGLILYEKEIAFFKKKGYRFVTCENYKQIIDENKRK